MSSLLTTNYSLPSMEIKELLKESREIWGMDRLPLAQIIVRIGKVFGDICRWERNAHKDAKTHNDADLNNQPRNLTFSTIKHCDDLGYDPEECITLAKECQVKFAKENQKT